MNADTLPHLLYRADQVRQLDRLAMECLGVSGFELMQRAGRAVFRQFLNRWPTTTALTVFCGGGNNGGDGYIVAGLAQRKGLDVQLLYLTDPGSLRNEAAEARDWAAARGVGFEAWTPSSAIAGEVIIDAMLGIGLISEVRSPYRDVIDAINLAGKAVVAIDLPSGLSSDTGMPLGTAIRADLTVTFIGVKQGLLTGLGPDYCGDLVFDDLGVTGEIVEKVDASARRMTWASARHAIRPRRPCAHKGEFGRVLIVGGHAGMGGAAILATEAAARSGAGLVHVATHPSHVAAFLVRCPEAMVKAVLSRQELAPLLARADAIVIGPGLGQGAWSQQMLQAVLESGKPLVLDADALNLIALSGGGERVRLLPHVMTPHPGEASRLLGKQIDEVQADRFRAVMELREEYGGVVLLKGAGTLIQGVLPTALPTLAHTGNPGMAAGGMGDVLSGIVGAFLAQDYSLRDAAELAACLHGEAARLAAMDKGYISLLPTDVIAAMPLLLRECDPRSRQAVGHESAGHERVCHD